MFSKHHIKALLVSITVVQQVVTAKDKLNVGPRSGQAIVR